MATTTPKIGLKKPVPNVETNWAFRLNESLDILDDSMLTANVSGVGTVVITEDGSGNVTISGSAEAGAGVNSLETLQGDITLTAAGNITITDDASDTITISGTPASVDGADHSILGNLDFASAGHTGFASEAELSSSSGTLNTQIGTDISTHAGITNAHHSKYTDGEAVVALEPITSELAASGVATDSQVSTNIIDIGALTTSGIAQDVLIAANSAEIVTVSGHLQSEIDAVEGSDVDSVNAVAGAVLITGTQNVTTQTVGQTITVTGPDLSSFATTAQVDSDIAAVSGTLSAEIDSDISTHTAIASAHHSRYADSEAVTALEPITSALAVSGTTTDANLSSHTGDATIHFTEASVDHGSIGGLADDDHTQYSLADGTRAFTGDVTMNADLTVDTNTLIVDSINNNVGIGVSPGATVKLDVAGNILRLRNAADTTSSFIIDSGDSSEQQSRIVFKDRGTDKWTWFKDAGGNMALFDFVGANNTIIIQTSASNANSIRINAGNVGIGVTPAVSNKLDVAGNSFRIKNTADSACDIFIDSGDTAAQQARIVFKDRGTDKWTWFKDSGNNIGLFDFAGNNTTITVETSASNINSLYIKAGNVGIGAAPVSTNKLDVFGDNFRLKSNADVTARMIIDGGASTSQTVMLDFRDQGTSKFSWRKNAANNFTLFDSTQTHDVMVLVTNSGNQHLLYLSGGNLGVGAAPGSFKLDVSGTGKFSDTLEVTTTTGYFLLPRLTDTQRDNLTGVAGATIYNTTTSKLNFYNGTAWEAVTSTTV